METTQQLKDIYTIGEVCRFKVKRVYQTYCELIDERNGITTYLQHTANLRLFQGQEVNCRIKDVKEKRPAVELVDVAEGAQGTVHLTESKLTDILTEQGIEWSHKDFIKLLLTEEQERPFETLCHNWIQTLRNKKADLSVVRRECSDLLELSELLNVCSDAEREYYQQRLTVLIEQIGYHIKADELISNEVEGDNTEGPKQFIDTLINKLKVSGFVYHPNKNFNILSCLFLRRPDIMNNRINEFLGIIREKDIKIWSKEPFRSALIKLLDLYIHECEGKIDKTKDNEELIQNTMFALAIQLLLNNDPSDTSVVDYRLTSAKLCAIASYWGGNLRNVINMAYSCLFDSDPTRIPYGIENIDKVPYYIANMASNKEIDTTNTFTQNGIRLEVSGDGIHLRPSRSLTNSYPVLPRELGLWKGLQIHLGSKVEVKCSPRKSNDIKPYQEMWTDIERELLDVSSQKTSTLPTNKRKRHKVNDLVNITFQGQDHYNKNKYYCKIEDEIGGEGYIFIEDIVPYNIQTSLWTFMASDGSRWVFPAQITDCDNDGFFHFSMIDTVKEGIDGIYEDEEDIYCSIGSAPNQFGMSPAITVEGVSASILNAGAFEGIEKNTIVCCRYRSKGSGTFHIQCDIVRVMENEEYDIYEAFRYLLENVSVGKIPDQYIEKDDEQILEMDKVLDEGYVRELIHLIDRMAYIDGEYIKSYNYLAFARILCKIIGWESQAAYYKGRMDIIIMLHDFGVNTKIGEKKLEELRESNAELFSNNAVMRDHYMQLLTVSYMNSPLHNDALYQISVKEPAIKELALLVLAHNIAKEYGMDKNAEDIHNKIKQRLNLRGFETGLKQYGSGIEGVHEEYKSSIVYHASIGSKGPNPKMQMDEILRVINSFLNTEGGTLYIGTNDLGMGVGVEEDLKTLHYNHDKDKYLRSITDAVAIKWGNAIAACIKRIEFDPENSDKDIVIVEVSPYDQGIDFDGEWYVRVGGSKRGLNAEQFAAYQAERGVQPKSEPKEPKKEAQPKSAPAPAPQPSYETIATSRVRKNILAEYLDYDNYDSYVEPEYYFKFLPNNKFKCLSDYDYDEQSPLTLTVLSDEIRGYLVLGYDNGHIVKVPVKELIEHPDREYSRYADAKLLFASIAGADDLVLTITRESKSHGKVVMRADQLSKCPDGRLSDSGAAFYNEGLASEVLAFEIIPSDKADDFSGILNKKPSTLGTPSNSSTKNMVNMLHLWQVNEI